MNNKIKIGIVLVLIISAVLIQNTTAMSNSDYSQLIALITSFINEQNNINQQVQDMNNTIISMNATINRICLNNVSLCSIAPAPTPTPTPTLGGYWQLAAQYNLGGDDHYIADRAMVSFHGHLYAGTMNVAGTHGRIVVYNENNGTYTPVIPYGDMVHAFVIHNDSLYYAGYGGTLKKFNENNDTGTIVCNSPYSNPQNIYSLVSYHGKVHAATSELWGCNETTGTWDIEARQYGSNTIAGVDMAVFNDMIMLGANIGGQILGWKTGDTSFELIAPIYASTDYTIHALKVFNDNLYIGTGSETAVNSHGYLLRLDEVNRRQVPVAGQYDSETQINTLDVLNGKLRGTGWRSWKSLEWDGISSWVPMTTTPPQQEQSHENGGGMTPYASTVHNGSLYVGSYGTGNLYKWVPN